MHAKLELITHAYFEEKDFTKVGLLEQTYQNLSHSLKESLTDGTQVFMGMYSSLTISPLHTALV